MFLIAIVYAHTVYPRSSCENVFQEPLFSKGLQQERITVLLCAFVSSSGAIMCSYHRTHCVDNSHTPWHSLGNACKTDNSYCTIHTKIFNNKTILAYSFQEVDLSKRIISYADSVDCHSGLSVIKRLLYVQYNHMHHMRHYCELHVPIHFLDCTYMQARYLKETGKPFAWRGWTICLCWVSKVNMISEHLSFFRRR